MGCQKVCEVTVYSTTFIYHTHCYVFVDVDCDVRDRPVDHKLTLPHERFEHSEISWFSSRHRATATIHSTHCQRRNRSPG